MNDEEIEAGREALARAGERLRRVSLLLGPAALVLTAVISLPALLFANWVTDSPSRYVINAVTLGILSVPAVVIATRIGIRDQIRTGEFMNALEAKLTSALDEAQQQSRRRAATAERQEFARGLASALEMADGEVEVVEVVERAFAETLPGDGAELLLADNSHAHLTRVAASPQATSCPVSSPDRCPAARRSQVQHFPDSERLDACPKLRGRPEGPSTAVCVPVSMMGRTVGVIHSAGPRGVNYDKDAVEDLQVLANLAGARIGLLRVLAESQLQAETDALTGLMNRRSLENRARNLRIEGAPFAVVMADLDHFKALNDSYGHETGDRALRTFAEVLKSAVRSEDLVSRHGGEEFVILMPGCSVEDAAERTEQLRAGLRDAIRRAGLPQMTASFGVVEALSGEDLNTSLVRADLALFQAKHEGRDRVVAHTDFIHEPQAIESSEQG